MWKWAALEKNMRTNSAHWCFSSLFKQRCAENFCLFPTVTVAEAMSYCSATAVLVLRWTFTWLAAITTPTHEHSPFFSVRLSFSTAVLITHLSTPSQQWFVSFILHALQASDHPERRPRLVWIDKNWGTAIIHGAPQKTTFYRTEQTTEALWTDQLYARYRHP